MLLILSTVLCILEPFNLKLIPTTKRDLEVDLLNVCPHKLELNSNQYNVYPKPLHL